MKAALAQVQANEPKLLEEQIRLCEIPAPPFKEQKRGEAYRDLFKSLGLRNVRIDAVGNVLGERPGKAEKPHLVFTAHLDTVFPEETNVKVTREGSVLKGPGIGDDCRGLAVVLGVIRALDAAKVQTPGTITFVGTVGEEGLGDLRGVKHLFNTELKGKIDRFVSVDGTGYGITHIGVGSKRYRVTFKGPGGHSYGAFGRVNPIHALGRAIDAISELPGAGRSENHLQRRPHRRRHVGQLDPVRSVDGSRHALDRRRLARRGRREIQEGDRRCAGGGKEALGKDRPDGGSEAGRRSPRWPHGRRFADRARRGVGDEGARACRSRWTKAPPTPTSA